MLKVSPNLTDFIIILFGFYFYYYYNNIMKAHKLKCLFCKKQLLPRRRKYCSKKCKVSTYIRDKYRKLIGIERKKLLIQLKGGKCEICNYSKNLAGLSFHHVVPRLKKFPLDARSCSNRSYKILLKELTKCQLLCLNCHAEIEHPHLKLSPVSRQITLPRDHKL